MKAIKACLHHIRITYFERISHDLKVHFNPAPDPLVNFLVCGTQRGGTTALDYYLRQHPQVCMASKKEVHYFDIEYNFRYNNIYYPKYHSFFDPQSHHLVTGEATPIYMYWQYAARRIWEYNPRMKLIILLRNPIYRAYSHWNLNRERGVENLPFLEALQIEESRRREALPFQDRYYSYLDRGLYSTQIRRLSSFFPPEQILILRSGDLRSHLQKAFDQICAFLEIPTVPLQEKVNIHAGTYHKNINHEDFLYLANYFHPEVKTLEALLNWDLHDWEKYSSTQP